MILTIGLSKGRETGSRNFYFSNITDLETVHDNNIVVENNRTKSDIRYNLTSSKRALVFAENKTEAFRLLDTMPVTDTERFFIKQLKEEITEHINKKLAI